MDMTSASSQYFAQVAGEWDRLRSGYFSEVVRQTAISKAYLRPEMSVADIGAGTGFMAAGLAPLVSRVYALDGSPEMLAVARQNLKDFDNVVFQEAEGLALPLPDASLEAVFANMYLHHCPDPLAAIREMARLLKPGGRLVITDMDAHEYEWMREEMADVWLGFEAAQVRAWYEQAGLVNIIIGCAGESCCAESVEAKTPAEQRQAEIGVFVAVGTRRVQAQSAVQEHYGALARGGTGSWELQAAVEEGCCTSKAEVETSCCAPQAEVQASCCSPVEVIPLEALATTEAGYVPGYSSVERAAAPSEAANFSLGCGNPTALARLQPGEVVLDIGSGGGLDAFLAARQVGPQGRVIGVDMTDEMLARARRSAQQAGLDNVEFRKGQAQALPVEDGSVDVVISNCVINLCEDKGQVFREAYRALKPGGRLEVSDVVTQGTFPAELRADPHNWGNCVFGALPEQEYLDLVAQAGFGEIKIGRSAQAGEIASVRVYSAMVAARKPA
ncbi:MAG: arsenite methyltransferase [Chloroflexota bacterium]